jgi:hypothetical protein
MVIILMVYISGTSRMLNVTLNALKRHDAGVPYELKILIDCRDLNAREEIRAIDQDVEIVVCCVGHPLSNSGQHGRILDMAVKEVKTPYVLTMDSDCFPVADGWISKALDRMEDDVVAVGIAWPWIPMSEQCGTLETRIREFHNWNNLQPAFQIIRTEVFKERHWEFADDTGDDTNHGFMTKAHKEGFKTVGLIPTRGPIADDGDEEVSEVNRQESLIYGDLIYHHVGASRECKGIQCSSGVFQKSRDRVYNELGAEWMLKDGESHRYKKDKEEYVAQMKMRSMYRAMTKFLETNDRLFDNNWA